MAGNFFANTRLVMSRLPQQSKPTGGGVISWQLPKVGFLASVWLRISVTVSGTLSSPNALGVSSIVRNVRLTTNSAIDLINVSGAGYAYLLDEMLETGLFRATGQNQGRSAVTASTFNLDMYLPVTVSLGNPLGTLLLQNEQTVVTLTVDFLPDSQVATGATVTATVEPVILYYLVPSDPRDFPRLNVLHTIIEDTRTISGAGQVEYTWPRGYTYMQVAHGLGIGASGTDGFTRVQLRIGQNQFPYDYTPEILNIQHYLLHGRARPAGGIYLDFQGLSGQGNYGAPRDLLNSALVTDIATLIQATGAGTLYTVRRQLVPLPE